MLPRSQVENTLEPRAIRLFEDLNIKHTDGSIGDAVVETAMLHTYTCKVVTQILKGILPIDGVVFHFLARTVA